MIQYFGYLSGMCIALSFLPYFIAIFKGTAKPERASWFIWATLGSIAFFSQLSKGASSSLWLPGVQTIGDIIVFILSIKYGMGGLLRRDKLALGVALIGLILWYVTQDATVAIISVVVADGAGAILTAVKSYEYPTTEPLSTWVLTGLGGFFALLAVGERNWVLLLFPLYAFFANIMIIVSITLGKRKLLIIKTLKKL